MMPAFFSFIIFINDSYSLGCNTFTTFICSSKMFNNSVISTPDAAAKNSLLYDSEATPRALVVLSSRGALVFATCHIDILHIMCYYNNVL